jgi:hypothetical protein
MPISAHAQPRWRLLSGGRQPVERPAPSLTSASPAGAGNERGAPLAPLKKKDLTRRLERPPDFAERKMGRARVGMIEIG